MKGPSCRLGFGIDLAELGRPEQAVLVELRLDEPERQPRGPDLLDLDLAHQERERADVVLVRVRQHDGTDRIVAEIPEVREDHIDAEVLVAWERHAGVDDDPLAGGLVHGHVLADLTEAAKRDHAEHICHLAPQCREALARGCFVARVRSASAHARTQVSFVCGPTGETEDAAACRRAPRRRKLPRASASR